MSQPTTTAPAPPDLTPAAPGHRAPAALDIAAAVLGVGLSVLMFWVVQLPENGGSTGAALLALTMTAPIIAVRRFPVAVALVLPAAALLNGLVVPDVVRCGAAFPAALVVAFVVGALARSRGWTVSLVGLAGVLGSLVAQWVFDPALNADAGFLGFGPPLAVLIWAAGFGVATLRRRRAGR